MILSQIFFFQAEDGIRDGHVTGVQTCALPIYRKSASFVPAQGADHPLNNWQRARALTATYRVDIFGHMDTKRVMANFAALSQETRLETFRLLVRHERKGLAAREIARRLGVTNNHLYN